MVESSFSATGISKSFVALKVLENVSITINSGEMVGLLGPNGAGKTTFILLQVMNIKIADQFHLMESLLMEWPRIIEPALV